MGDARTPAPERKRITVRDITWYYAVGSDFKANGVVLRPEDAHVILADQTEVVRVDRQKRELVVKPGWLWREELEYEVEITVPAPPAPPPPPAR